MSRTAKVKESSQHNVAALDVTGTLTDFVRQELRRCRLATLEDGKPVSVAVLAGRIQAVDETLDFSPETLRRFLNGEKQKTSPSTIRAIAAFLIDEQWLTIAELQEAGTETDYRAAFALNDFFKVRPSKANAEFCRSLAGRYRQYLFDVDRFVKREWLISFDESAGAVKIAETIIQYSISPDEVVLSRLMRRGIRLSDIEGLDRMKPDRFPIIGATLTASGFGVSDHRIVAFFATNARTGRPQIYSLASIAFNDDDEIVALGGYRHDRWQTVRAAADPDLDLPEIQHSPRDESPWWLLYKAMGPQS